MSLGNFADSDEAEWSDAENGSPVAGPSSTDTSRANRPSARSQLPPEEARSSDLTDQSLGEKYCLYYEVFYRITVIILYS